MCTRFQLNRIDLIAHTEPLNIELTLAEVLGAPGYWPADKFVPASLVRWAALPHQPNETRVATIYSAGNPGVATYKYRLTTLSP